MIYFEEDKTNGQEEQTPSPSKRRFKKKPDQFDSSAIKPNAFRAEPPVTFREEAQPQRKERKEQQVAKAMEVEKVPIVPEVVRPPHAPEDNSDLLVFDTQEPEQQQQGPPGLSRQHEMEEHKGQRDQTSNQRPTEKLTLFEHFATQNLLSMKKHLLYTKCDSKQEFELVRVKDSSSTVYLLYVVNKKERLFICGTKKNSTIHFTEFEISLHRDLLEDIKGSELYAGHVRSSFTRDCYCFFQNYKIKEFEQKRACGSVEWERPFLSAPITKLTLKYDSEGKDIRRFYSSPLTQKERFDMKHAWGVVDSKKNIILKPKDEKQGVVRANILIGKNNDAKLTMVVSEELSSFQAFCFAISHLTHLE